MNNNIIEEFQGKYRFLSNFSPSKIFIGGIVYPTVEHYYQAMKTFITAERQRISNAPTPGKAKRLGQQLELRPYWEDIKILTMKYGLIIKFKHPKLTKQLITTFPRILIEGNRWGDTFWGIDLETWEGENHLGKLLMEIRSDLLYK